MPARLLGPGWGAGSGGEPVGPGRGLHLGYWQWSRGAACSRRRRGGAKGECAGAAGSALPRGGNAAFGVGGRAGWPSRRAWGGRSAPAPAGGPGLRERAVGVSPSPSSLARAGGEGRPPRWSQPRPRRAGVPAGPFTPRAQHLKVLC